MPRFCLSLLDNEDDDDSSENDDYENVEPPHPIGFSPGSSRYTFDEKYYDSDNDDDDSGNINNDGSTAWTGDDPAVVQDEQVFPPISYHVNTMTSPMKALVRHVLESNSQQRRRLAARRDDDDAGPSSDNIDTLTRALRDGTMFGVSSPLSLSLSSTSPSRSLLATTTTTTTGCQLLPTTALYASLARQEARIGQDMISTKQRFEREHQESARSMQALLDSNQQKAEQKQARLKKLQDEQAAEQQAQEDRLEAQRQEEQRKRDALEQQQEEQRQAQQAKLEAQRVADEDAKKKVAAATEYMTRADKLIAQLKQLRASVESFETSKNMAKRRLAMKKIINGRVNTLSEDVEKIRAVANDVSAAIATSRQEDAHYKSQIDAGQAEYTAEMARGKRYFLDLLSSKVVVRVQAEGFNGQRGDGFPLAAMLAAIAVDNKDLVPVLTAHIYTVCPTAIPKLPTPSPDATEEELMESLGMIKGKNGEFETFERFLSRTEGLISIVADIMSSEPSTHTLFGGHEGAVKWLARFLSQLPPAPQSPLPLFTAPVLDAFLTGAGHMLANKHPEDFKKYLGFIIDDCLPRIDEGTIGKPSATRLRKTLQGNFDGFKNKLPSRALAELYYGANSTSHHGAPAGSSSSSMGGVSQPSPFGPSAPSTAPRNPFAAPPSSSTAAPPNPFGVLSTTTANTTTAAVSSPHFATAFGPSSSSSSSQNPPFGGGGGQQSSTANAPFASPFGGATAPAAPSAAPIPSPFGPGLISPSPFGSTSAAPAPTPFVTNTASPFGNNNPPTASPFASPFGQQQQQQQTPFGGGGGGFGAPAPASGGGFASSFGGAPAGGGMGLFGGHQPAQQQSAFGASAPAFGGGTAASVPSPFGASALNSSPFGISVPNISPFAASFGAPPASAASQQSPFGVQQSPFGASSSFGAPSAFGTTAPSPSPFGTAAPSPSPFGGSFGSGTGQFGGGGSGNLNNNKTPCKFFAQGACRYGSNCRFSHDTAVGGGGGGFNAAPSPFSNFGGPRR